MTTEAQPVTVAQTEKPVQLLIPTEGDEWMVIITGYKKTGEKVVVRRVIFVTAVNKSHVGATIDFVLEGCRYEGIKVADLQASSAYPFTLDHKIMNRSV